MAAQKITGAYLHRKRRSAQRHTGKQKAFLKTTSFKRLIQMSLHDMDWVEKQKGVSLEMEPSWLHIDKHGQCKVCMAGAVLYRTFKMREIPDNFHYVAKRPYLTNLLVIRMQIIDYFRARKFSDCIRLFYPELHKKDRHEIAEKMHTYFNNWPFSPRQPQYYAGNVLRCAKRLEKLVEGGLK